MRESARERERLCVFFARGRKSIVCVRVRTLIEKIVCVCVYERAYILRKNCVCVGAYARNCSFRWGKYDGSLGEVVYIAVT